MWNLDRVHKIGDFVAAIAVVISLLFVGIEISRNNSIQRQQATRSLSRDWSDVIASFQDPELACLFIRLGNDRAKLTAQEATQIEAVIWRIYKVYEEFHYQHGQGMIDESVWRGFKQLIVTEQSFGSYRVWWGGYQKTFSPRFRNFIDGIMDETSENANSYFVNLECDKPVGDDYWREYE